MTYEIVITVLDERIAHRVKEKIEQKCNSHCDIRPSIPNFHIGDKVQVTFCEDTTVYVIERIKLDRFNDKIYHLKGVQGWKAGINLMHYS